MNHDFLVTTYVTGGAIIYTVEEVKEGVTIFKGLNKNLFVYWTGQDKQKNKKFSLFGFSCI